MLTRLWGIRVHTTVWRTTRAMHGAALALGVASCATLQGHATTRPEFWGFVAPWDRRGATTVAQHGDQCDVLISGLIVLDSASFQPVQPVPDTLASRNVGNRRYMALVTSSQGARFHPETVRGIASDSAFLARTAGAIAAMVGRGGYRGMVMDFEGMTPDDLSSLRRVVSAIADSARAHGVGPIGVAVPATDTAAYPARLLLESTDFVMVRVYGQHWRTSPPGPIVSPDWARRWLGVRIGEIGPGKIVAVFPTYGYRWPADSAAALLSYTDAERVALDANVMLGRDGTSGMLHAQTPRWTLWMTDASQLDQLIRDARVSGITKFALWRLGLEDPAIWTRVVPPYTTIRSR